VTVDEFAHVWRHALNGRHREQRIEFLAAPAAVFEHDEGRDRVFGGLLQAAQNNVAVVFRDADHLGNLTDVESLAKMEIEQHELPGIEPRGGFPDECRHGGGFGSLLRAAQAVGVDRVQGDLVATVLEGERASGA
jgi:hypothetical protein